MRPTVCRSLYLTLSVCIFSQIQWAHDFHSEAGPITPKSAPRNNSQSCSSSSSSDSDSDAEPLPSQTRPTNCIIDGRGSGGRPEKEERKCEPAVVRKERPGAVRKGEAVRRRRSSQSRGNSKIVSESSHASEKQVTSDVRAALGKAHAI